MLKLLKNFGAGLALASFAINAVPASAQIAPTARGTDQMAASMPADSSMAAPSVASAPTGSDQGFVMLADLVPAGEMPRAARPSTIAEDTPALTHAQFITRYPQAGEAAYQRIRSSNKNLCDKGFEYMAMVLDFDQQFKNSDDEYQELQRIYEALPGNIKRTTALMTITQAASAGALCALSAGLYCIAVVVGGIGNIFSAQTNKKLQLANVRLSLANIRLTRLNIASNRLTLRLDAFWLDLVVPYCQKIFPGAAASAAGSFSAQLPSLTRQGN